MVSLKFLAFTHLSIVIKKDGKMGIFDNSKIKQIAKGWTSVVGYEEIAPIAVKNYLSNKDLQKMNPDFEAKYDEIIAAYEQKQKTL